MRGTEDRFHGAVAGTSLSGRLSGDRWGSLAAFLCIVLCSFLPLVIIADHSVHAIVFTHVFAFYLMHFLVSLILYEHDF